jgi:Tol biopolymer transport system component
LAGALAVVAVLLIAWWRMQPGVPSIESVTQLSDDGEPKTGSLETDGSRIYFNEGEAGNLKVAEVSVAGGATAGIDSGIGDPTMAGLMPGGSKLLVLAGGRAVFSYPLWSISLPTGEPRRLGALEGQDANFFPDGRLLIANGRELEVAERDGSNPRSLLFMAGNVMLEEPSVSPDGKRIAFTSYSRAWSTSVLFESAADGKGTHAILNVGKGAQPCCVAWSPDGKYLLYTTTNPGSSGLWGGGSDLWALPMQSGFFHRSGNPYPGRPIRLTAGPLSYSGAVVSRDGKQIYAIGTKRRSELVRYDMKSHQFLPFLDGISALDPTFSKDGKWVAYTAYPEHTLWRSRSDGTDRLQLTYPPMAVAAPSLSPDGRQIAFRNSGRDLFVISMNGGAAKEIAQHADVPSWSPDGNLLVFTCFTEPMDDSSRWYIQIFDFRTGKTSIVPSSKGRIGGVWISQDKLVAAPVLSTKFLIFDLKTQAWTDLTTGSFVNWTVSPDGKYLYFTNQGADLEVQRLRFADRQIETITSLKELRSAFDDLEGTWLNVAPDGSPVLARDLGTQEIYSLNVRWRR